MFLRRIILLTMSVLLVLPTLSMLSMPLKAASFKGVTMDDAVEVEGQKLILNGMALRKKFVFKVYVAGLYLPQKESNADAILQADQPRRGVMHWLRSVETGKINEGWYDGLKANTPNHSPELKTQFDTLAGMMENMKDGELIIFTYIPGKGTEVSVKSKIKGIIEGKAFADALFGCWIGPKPGPGEDFKNSLLGK